MNARILRLRTRSLEAQPSLSDERARLLTRFYQSGVARTQPVPVQRAMAFAHIMANKTIPIDPDELIVGERGPAPKSTPTYPEVCIHSPEDLAIISGREKVAFAVDESVRKAYAQEVIPFWQGHSIRETLFSHLPDDWKLAYDAGIFTEFQEQRSPGHTACGDKPYKKGLLDLKFQIEETIACLDFFNDPQAMDRKHELTAMAITADGMIAFARRHADRLDAMAAVDPDARRRAKLEQMAVICRRVPAHAPRTFWEALQAYWFVHVGVITELNPWDAFNPGRLDQHLYPFYKKDLAEGRLTEERARELLSAFWIKFNNHPAPPKTGVTAKESNTYVDFALINVGGVRATGADAVNDLSYLILDVIEEMRLLQPSSMVQLSKKNPDRFIRRALRIVRTGFGQPSIFNTDAIVQELVRQGKSVADARQGGCSGCVEAGAFGREAYFLTGYFNLPKILELTLNNGIDPRTGRQLGPATGDPCRFETFADLFEAWMRQLNHFIDIKIRGNNIIEQINARQMPVPFLSLYIDDCIEKGRDYNAGGARYNTSYIQGVGLGSISDALTALKEHVFSRKTVCMADVLKALKSNFDGFDDLRHRLLEDTPKYGNDDDAADDVMQMVFEAYYRAVDGRPNTRGGVHRINLLPTTCHVYFGSITGALPDGRMAGTPLSEGISPVQGADRNGPTAVARSAAKMDHIRTGGTLLNQKFLPQVLEGDAGITKLAQLVRTYFRMDGHHIQFNVVDRTMLEQAKRTPDDYRDLIVRVAGYSDYFVDLTEELQDEIIRRTAHEDV
ncbi:trans-4-hydroxy-L-proline dehydratase [Desulfosarcina ovata]|uniref:Glycyl radical enzyme n=1 Tax=Desulfosarcina ovata subsp. ovata TaxID=2752305 RepID=A0A5K8AH13_9BACT|nr:trans-4-hydroxy-L-proline dehydratase [Desulfosarcina ovata]BBO91144.1 glycyl radical enzyme [Desulfosarcina ovata subsp. ovata]